MGILVYVYRNNNGDSTNGGISSKEDSLVVPEVAGPFDDYPDADQLVIEHTQFGARLVPKLLVDAGTRPMFGGNFAGSSDSRWSRYLENMLGYNPRVLPIFDRVE